LSASFAKALEAAHDAAGSQNHPASTLYVVATPIGNLADISLRALHVLSQVDAIACEDTRHTQQLLRAYGLDRPSSQLLAVHQHNEAEAAQNVIARLAQGERVAYVLRSGLLDDRICEVCEGKDGETFAYGSPEHEANLCPDSECLGTSLRCRCMLIEVFADEGEGAQQSLNLQGLAEIYPEVKPFADYVMGLRVNALALAARKAIAGQT
jgi:hypothetical protein